MQYIENSNKSVDEVVKTIEEKISDYQFGILHIHNVKETLNSKGLEFKNECRILDICKPAVAQEVLSRDMSISSMMPCKISVYEDNGQTFIAMNSIVQMIDDLNPDFIEIAQEVQETLLKLIEEVK